MQCGIDRTILRNLDVGRERRPADARQIEIELEVPDHPQRCGHHASRIDLAHVTLAVAQAERAHLEAVAPGDGRRRVGVESAAQQHDRRRTRRHTPRYVRSPDELVGLQLQSHRQRVGEYPGRERSGVQHAVHRGEEHGRHPAGEPLARDDVAGILVVGAILDHELDLIRCGQAAKVRPVHLLRLPRARTLDVDDPDHTRGHVLDAAVTAGFEQHGLAVLEQPAHERIDVVLQQRLASGDFDRRTVVAADLGQHVVDRHLPALVEGVGRIAPDAAQVAGRQTDEDARLAGEGRLALNRVEDFVDGQHCCDNRQLYRRREGEAKASPYNRQLLSMALLIGTSGWNYPAGRGTWNGIFYPERRPAEPRLRRIELLRRALQHGGSEFDLLRPAAPAGEPGMGQAHAAGLRVRRQALSEVHAPEGVREGRAQRNLRPRSR